MQGFYERPGGVNHEGLLEALRCKLEDESVSLIILERHRLFEEKAIVDESADPSGLRRVGVG